MGLQGLKHDILEEWIAPSQGHALEQKAHLDCLTLKMKAVQSLESYLLMAKYHITKDLNIQ